MIEIFDSPYQVKAHTCHALDCTTPTSPAKLMCFRHWRSVPNYLKTEVNKHYRTGQECDKRITPEWLKAASAAIKAVASLEGKLQKHQETV